MNPRVEKVIVLDNYKLQLTFTNGEVGIFDIKPYLKEKFWSKLTDEDIFKGVAVAGGSVEWLGGEIDFCPDEVYEKSERDKKQNEKLIDDFIDENIEALKELAK